MKVTQRKTPPSVAFASVRARVREAWLTDRRAEANATFVRDLRKRYRVVVAGVDN